MRFAGFTLAALLAAATAVLAQPPAVPGTPAPAPGGAPQPPAPPPQPPAADPKALDAHLLGWQNKMADVKNLRAELTLTRTEATFKKATNFSGVVLCMKPNYAVMRLDNADDKTKADYEAYISDGKSLYAYNGLQKTIVKYDFEQQQAGVDNLMLDFLSGMKADAVKQRFNINLFKTDAHYIYLDIKPLRPADQKEFTQLRLALYGPATKFAYLPAQVYMVKPNGDTEMWAFANPQVDIPNVTPANFKFVPVQGFKVEQAPKMGAPAAPMGPTGVPPKTPTGGAVRP